MVLYTVIGAPEHFQHFGVLMGIALLLWGAGSGVIFWLIGVAGETRVTLRSLFDPLSPKS